MGSKDPFNILLLEDEGEDGDLVMGLLKEVCDKEICSVVHRISPDKILSSEAEEDPQVIIIGSALSGRMPSKLSADLAEKFIGATIIAVTSFNILGKAKNEFMCNIQDFIFKKNLDRETLWKTIMCAMSRKRMELSLKHNKDSLDRANSILKVTSEISSSILEGQTDVEDMLPVIGRSLGIDGVAVFCDECLSQQKPYCYWVGGRMEENVFVDTECRSEGDPPDEIMDLIRGNTPICTKIRDLPEAIKAVVSLAGFSDTSKVVVVPIIMDHAPWGFFCFYTVNGKMWSMAEVDALANLSRLGGAIIRSKQMEQELLTEMREQFSVINKRMNGEGG